ncbi:ABC transporter permease [Streptococcus rifensis]
MNILVKENRILLKEMIKTDFKLRYQGSLIGHLWSILKPMMLFTIMYFVFIRFLRIDDGTPHTAIGVLFSLVTWNFFSEATNMGMLSIVNRGDLLRKLNFPKEIVVISSTASAGINYGINLLVVIAFALINGIQFSNKFLILIPLFIELVFLATGIAFILSSLFVKYRDIGPIWEVIMQAGMYGTPVIYSITYILQNGHNEIAKLLMLNPLAQIVQDIRHFIVFSGNPRGWDLINNKMIAIIPYIIPILIFVIGLFIFRKNAKKFAEIL